MTVNNFDVLKTMADRNGKIKSFPVSNVTYAASGKVHGNLHIMVDNETATKIMLGDPIIFSLIVADVDEFEKTRADLEAELRQKDGTP